MDEEWPIFRDPFLEDVKQRLRERSTDLWYRGRLYFEGNDGPGSAEALIVSLDVRPRRSIVMCCEPGGVVTLSVRGTGRSDDGRLLFTSRREAVACDAERLVRGYEDAVSIVLRSPDPRAFADELARAWEAACSSSDALG